MTKRSPFKYFKTSPEIIRLAVMLYVQFPLSLRNVEDLLHERGIEVSHETVRFWWQRFGPMFASEIGKRRIAGLKSSRGQWHLDEVFVKVNGKRHYLWRAVDHEGEVLESFVTKMRDKKAALKFLRKAMRRHGRPEVVVTDRLRSYGAAPKRNRWNGAPEDRALAQQSSRKLTSANLMTRAGDAAFQADAKFADVRFRPCVSHQSLQPGAQPKFPIKFQAEPCRCSR
jgi:transposase-like protein